MVYILIDGIECSTLRRVGTIIVKVIIVLDDKLGLVACASLLGSHGVLVLALLGHVLDVGGIINWSGK